MQLTIEQVAQLVPKIQQLAQLEWIDWEVKLPELMLSEDPIEYLNDNL